jgi:hypothetical protein
MIPGSSGTSAITRWLTISRRGPGTLSRYRWVSGAANRHRGVCRIGACTRGRAGRSSGVETQSHAHITLRDKGVDAVGGGAANSFVCARAGNSRTRRSSRRGPGFGQRAHETTGRSRRPRSRAAAFKRSVYAAGDEHRPKYCPFERRDATSQALVKYRGTPDSPCAPDFQ